MQDLFTEVIYWKLIVLYIFTVKLISIMTKNMHKNRGFSG